MKELDRRIRKRAGRYATPLPKLTEDEEALAARVDQHLKPMGRHGSEARVQADGGGRHS